MWMLPTMAAESGKRGGRRNAERPAWRSCLLGQFHISPTGRFRGPRWFYLMLLALLAFFYGERNRMGYWAGGLILLGAALCAVQETRLRRGIVRTKPGWWSVVPGLLALAAGLLFVAEGAANGDRETLTLGLAGCMLSVMATYGFTRRRPEGENRVPGRAARAGTILIALVVLGLACLAAFLYFTWRIQELEAELARFYGSAEEIIRNPGLASDIERALHGRPGLYRIRRNAGVGALAAVFGLLVWWVERFRRAIGKD